MPAAAKTPPVVEATNAWAFVHAIAPPGASSTNDAAPSSVKWPHFALVPLNVTVAGAPLVIECTSSAMALSSRAETPLNCWSKPLRSQTQLCAVCWQRKWAAFTSTYARRNVSSSAEKCFMLVTGTPQRSVPLSEKGPPSAPTSIGVSPTTAQLPLRSRAPFSASPVSGLMFLMPPPSTTSPFLPFVRTLPE